MSHCKNSGTLVLEVTRGNTVLENLFAFSFHRAIATKIGIIPYCYHYCLGTLFYFPSGLSQTRSGGHDPSCEWGVEFGMVLIYSCSASCWDDSDGGQYRQEWVMVQPDPDCSPQ